MRAWIGVLLVAWLAGCGSSRPDMDSMADPVVASSPIVGPQWKLTLLGTDTWWQGDHPAHITLFQKGKKLLVSGSDGCNKLQGEATLGDGQYISIAVFATTQITCPSSPLSSEVADMLSRAHRYLVDHDRLVLMGRDGHVLGGFKRQG